MTYWHQNACCPMALSRLLGVEQLNPETEMRDLKITTRKLEDGSTVHQVRFNAPNADGSYYQVTLEANDRKAAARLFDALNADVAYAETDPA
jgi:hypothetical protein